MEITEYNKKAFLLPDSINSAAMFHAKLFKTGEYIFRIHDCITGIRLRGELKDQLDFVEAEMKLKALSDACLEFAIHIAKMRKQNFKFHPGLHDYSSRL
jgi:hypothetical protein